MYQLVVRRVKAHKVQRTHGYRTHLGRGASPARKAGEQVRTSRAGTGGGGARKHPCTMHASNNHRRQGRLRIRKHETVRGVHQRTRYNQQVHMQQSILDAAKELPGALEAPTAKKSTYTSTYIDTAVRHARSPDDGWGSGNAFAAHRVAPPLSSISIGRRSRSPRGLSHIVGSA